MVRRSLGSQIVELQRERAMRQRVFQGMVDKGSMKPDEMAYRIATIDASIRTLTWVQKHQNLIRQRCPELFGGGS